ncbi:hypothetical protein NVP1187O_003 [Vibrio phage 1.187.O._10N.286.49.F1]|nr:hypothetical protein NVP1187O_003 [Vibrio phage 1.187.O._10N.286.49.F1]
MSIEKDLAKYTGLQLVATQLKHQCDARDTLHQFDYDDEFLEEVDTEVLRLVGSLYERSDKLNLKYHGLLPNYVAESQDPNNI